MKPRIHLSLEVLAVGFFTLLTASSNWAQINSYARIVRLSFIEGEVSVQRPDIQTWAEAPVNTPLQEGFKLSTGEGSFAEIQLENGGTIRLGERSLLDLTKLERAPNGETINRLELRQGYATFHLLPSHIGASFQVGTPYGTVTAQGGTQFRVDLQEGAQRVEVFTGAADVQSRLGNLTVEKGSTLLMQPGPSESTVVSEGITRDDWDNWVDDRESRAQLPPEAPSPNTFTGDAMGTTYGWNDLLRYGTWSDVPGIGYGWAPNRVGAGWSPYSTGQWCWYPGLGYTWIGAEPWGWLPYHYGGWDFIAGRGWVWFPVSLRNWSPGRVTWFHGPNWVGWTPRHIKDGTACGYNCGGGVVSTSTFRNGGLLNSNAMLRYNPTTGERVNEPGIPPSTGTRLTGRPASAPGPRHPNSTIVYDPQEHSYVNSGHVVTPQRPPELPAAESATAGPAGVSTTSPGRVEPQPAGGREHGGRTLSNQEYGQPIPVGGTEQQRRTLSNQGFNQPVPVEGREQQGQTWQNQVVGRPMPAGNGQHRGRAGDDQGFHQPHHAAGSNSAMPVPATPQGNANTYAAPANHGNEARPASSAPPSVSPAGRGGGGQAPGGHVGGGPIGGSHVEGGGGNAGGGHH